MANDVIDETITVDQMVARYPETMRVFNRYGLDTCCGGGAPIADAARRDGADLEELMQALRETVATGVA
jgi:regulator of cell morphogenesis and NO signaling